jgi:phosphatidate phosphatase PAH1
VIVIKWPNGEYRSTPFLVCFGSHSILNREASIKILINDQTTIQTKTRVNRHGYMNHVYMTQERIEEMKLNFGMNKIKYILEDCQI